MRPALNRPFQNRTASARQEGSALLFALLAMVFLTVIGLSLAVVTETEMLIGINEQIAQETFFASEAAVSTSIAQLLLNKDVLGRYFAIPSMQGDDIRTFDSQVLGYTVDYTDIYPVAFSDTPWTAMNEGQEEKAYSFFFYTETRARRLAWPDTLDVPDCESEAQRDIDDPIAVGNEYFESIQAEKVLTVGFYVAPIIGLAGGETLFESFEKPNAFACSPEPKDEDYIQKVP